MARADVKLVVYRKAGQGEARTATITERLFGAVLRRIELWMGALRRNRCACLAPRQALGGILARAVRPGKEPVVTYVLCRLGTD